MNYTRQDIRQYIIENRLKYSYYNPGGDPLMDASALADSAGHIAQNSLALVSSYTEKAYRYEQDYENVKNRAFEIVKRKAISELDPETDKYGEARAVQKAYEAFTKGIEGDDREKSKYFQDIQKSNDYKLLKLGEKAANFRMATQTVSAARATVENVIAISTIIRDRAKEKAISRSTLMEAEDILDKAYRIKEEGENRLKNLDMELKKLQEGFISNIINGIKGFFFKNKTESEKLLIQAKKLKSKR